MSILSILYQLSCSFLKIKIDGAFDGSILSTSHTWDNITSHMWWRQGIHKSFRFKLCCRSKQAPLLEPVFGFVVSNTIPYTLLVQFQLSSSFLIALEAVLLYLPFNFVLILGTPSNLSWSTPDIKTAIRFFLPRTI